MSPEVESAETRTAPQPTATDARGLAERVDGLEKAQYEQARHLSGLASSMNHYTESATASAHASLKAHQRASTAMQAISKALRWAGFLATGAVVFSVIHMLLHLKGI